MRVKRAGLLIGLESAPYEARSRRTLATAAMIEGFFGFMWFGWGQEDPPAWASILLVAGAVLAMLVAAAGIACVRRARYEPAPLAGTAARRYGVIVGAECASAGAGAAILALMGHPTFVAAWVCCVVGTHFVPLDRVFPGIGMIGLGIALVLVAMAAVLVGVSTSMLPSTVAGVGAGACLVGHASSLLVAARRVDDRGPGSV